MYLQIFRGFGPVETEPIRNKKQFKSFIILLRTYLLSSENARNRTRAARRTDPFNLSLGINWTAHLHHRAFNIVGNVELIEVRYIIVRSANSATDTISTSN